MTTLPIFPRLFANPLQRALRDPRDYHRVVGMFEGASGAELYRVLVDRAAALRDQPTQVSSGRSEFDATPGIEDLERALLGALHSRSAGLGFRLPPGGRLKLWYSGKSGEGIGLTLETLWSRRNRHSRRVNHPTSIEREIAATMYLAWALVGHLNALRT